MTSQLQKELDRIIAGSGDPADLSGVTLPEIFDFSGLTRRAWVKALGIGDSTWGQYRAGLQEVPEEVREKAIRLSLSIAAARSGVEISASKKLAEIKKIIQ